MKSVVGEDHVFWYGVDTRKKWFEPGEVGSASIIGGHRQIDFYPNGFDALYTAVVRDPVRRAISYFNYCTRVSDSEEPEWKAQRQKDVASWQNLGVDPQSMTKSIKKCREFRNLISNYQCAYLSRRRATHKGVLRTIESENMVIGLFEGLEKFNRFFRDDLGFAFTNSVQSNIGAEGYYREIESEPGLVELVASLNKEDQALYDYLRRDCDSLCVSADNIQALRAAIVEHVSASNLNFDVGKFDWSLVDLRAQGAVAPGFNNPQKMQVMLQNKSQYSVHFGAVDDRTCGIGWVVVDDQGQYLEDLRGVEVVELAVPSRESRVFKIDVCLPQDRLQGRTPVAIELCIVECGTWMNDHCPGSSTRIPIHE